MLFIRTVMYVLAQKEAARTTITVCDYKKKADKLFMFSYQDNYIVYKLEKMGDEKTLTYPFQSGSYIIFWSSKFQTNLCLTFFCGNVSHISQC